MGRLLRRADCWGVILRLVLMPISCHYDLLSYYWGAHEVVFHHHYPFEGQLLGDLYRLFPTAYLNIAWLWLIRPFFGSLDPWAHDWFPGGDPYFVNDVAWRAFVGMPRVGLILLLLKLPHLLCEWAVIRWLCAMKPDPRERGRLEAFLWLNPVSLFVLYVFGSMEIFVVLLLVRCLLCAFKNRRWQSAWLLGTSATFRLFPVLFFPAFALICARRPAQRLRLGAAALLPFLVWLGIVGLRSPGLLGFLAGYQSITYVLSLKLPLQFSPVGESLYPFVIGWIFVIGLSARGQELPHERLTKAMLATLLVLYATCYVHPQYFFWFIPCLALRMASDSRLFPLFVIQVLCYTVYTFQWGRHLAGYLFAPLNPDFFMALRSPMELLASICPQEKIIGLAHSVLSGTSLWMAYLTLGSTRRSGKG